MTPMILNKTAPEKINQAVRGELVEPPTPKNQPQQRRALYLHRCVSPPPHRQLTNPHRGVTLVAPSQGDQHGIHHHTETTRRIEGAYRFRCTSDRKSTSCINDRCTGYANNTV